MISPDIQQVALTDTINAMTEMNVALICIEINRN